MREGSVGVLVGASSGGVLTGKPARDESAFIATCRRERVNAGNLLWLACARRRPLA